MGAMSNYTESGILNLLLRANSNSFAAPSIVALALTRDHPTDVQTGATINELPFDQGGGYERLVLGVPANADWNEIVQVNGSGLVDNAANLDFATATADWNGVSGVAICDEDRVGSGNVLFHGPLTTFRNVTNGDTFRFSAGDLDVLLD